MSAAPSATERSKRAAKANPSGRLLLRMPAALHAELARWAERDGVSLNQFITRTLSARIGWGSEEGAVEAPAELPTQQRSNLILVALVANAIVIGLAAAAAIGVLVLAWRG